MALTTTFQKFLNNAAARILQVSPGGGISGNQLAFWVDGFSEVVRSMSGDRSLLFFVPDVQYTLVNAKESFEIGPGAADFDTTGGAYTRPVFVESVRVKVGNARRFPLNMCTEQEFAVSPWRNATHPDGPTDFYYASGIPKATFNFAAQALAGQICWVSQWNPLREFDLTETNLLMEDYYPNEYIRMLQLGLGVHQCSAYGKTAPQELVADLQAASQIVRDLNNTRLMGSAGQTRTLNTPKVGVGVSVGQQPGQQG